MRGTVAERMTRTELMLVINAFFCWTHDSYTQLTEKFGVDSRRPEDMILHGKLTKVTMRTHMHRVVSALRTMTRGGAWSDHIQLLIALSSYKVLWTMYYSNVLNIIHTNLRRAGDLRLPLITETKYGNARLGIEFATDMDQLNVKVLEMYAEDELWQDAATHH